MSINRVTLSGNLTRDAELKVTEKGTAIASFGIAVNESRKNAQTGKWEDDVNFVDCVMFGKRAEGVAKYLTKGTRVFLEGKLHQSTWEKDDQKHSKLEVIVDDLDFASNTPKTEKE